MRTWTYTGSEHLKRKPLAKMPREQVQDVQSCDANLAHPTWKVKLGVADVSSLETSVFLSPLRVLSLNWPLTPSQELLPPVPG